MQTAAAPAATRRGAVGAPPRRPRAPGADLDRHGTSGPTAATTAATIAAARRRIAEERRAGARLDDLAHRAGHVEVHKVGAGGDAPRGRVRQHVRRPRRTAGSRWGARRAARQVVERAPVAVVHAAGRDHLREHQTGAPAANAAPKGAVVMPAIGAMNRRRSSCESADTRAARRGRSSGAAVGRRGAAQPRLRRAEHVRSAPPGLRQGCCWRRMTISMPRSVRTGRPPR